MDNVDANEQELLSGNIRKTVWKYGIPCALITILIGSGCAAQFSILLGKGEHEKAAHSVGNSLVLLIEGVVFTMLSLLYDHDWSQPDTPCGRETENSNSMGNHYRSDRMIFAKNILLLFGSGSELYVQFGTSLIRTYLILCTFSGLILCPLIGVRGVMLDRERFLQIFPRSLHGMYMP
jgi:hypothetical protein